MFLWGSVLSVLHFLHASLDEEGVMVGLVMKRPCTSFHIDRFRQHFFEKALATLSPHSDLPDPSVFLPPQKVPRELYHLNVPPHVAIHTF